MNDSSHRPVTNEGFALIDAVLMTALVALLAGSAAPVVVQSIRAADDSMVRIDYLVDALSAERILRESLVRVRYPPWRRPRLPSYTQSPGRSGTVPIDSVAFHYLDGTRTNVLSVGIHSGMLVVASPGSVARTPVPPDTTLQEITDRGRVVGTQLSIPALGFSIAAHLGSAGFGEK